MVGAVIDWGIRSFKSSLNRGSAEGVGATGMSRGRPQAGQAARVPANEALALKLWPQAHVTLSGCGDGVGIVSGLRHTGHAICLP